MPATLNLHNRKGCSRVSPRNLKRPKQPTETNQHSIVAPQHAVTHQDDKTHNILISTVFPGLEASHSAQTKSMLPLMHGTGSIKPFESYHRFRCTLIVTRIALLGYDHHYSPVKIQVWSFLRSVMVATPISQCSPNNPMVTLRLQSPIYRTLT